MHACADRTAARTAQRARRRCWLRLTGRPVTYEIVQSSAEVDRRQWCGRTARLWSRSTSRTCVFVWHYLVALGCRPRCCTEIHERRRRSGQLQSGTFRLHRSEHTSRCNVLHNTTITFRLCSLSTIYNILFNKITSSEQPLMKTLQVFVHIFIHFFHQFVKFVF